MSDSQSGIFTRVYTDEVRTLFQLDNAAGPAPKNGYFEVPLSHPNYKVMFSFGLAAAIKKTSVHIRTNDALSAGEHGVVTYIVADY
jgi:hypothetical protein